MLYAIQSQVESSASASTIIAKVVPPKCAQLIAKSVGSANFVANHDIQEKGQQAYYEKPSKPSFLELLSGKPLGENFARR
jgi:hypothetical protein